MVEEKFEDTHLSDIDSVSEKKRWVSPQSFTGSEVWAEDVTSHTTAYERTLCVVADLATDGILPMKTFVD